MMKSPEMGVEPGPDGKPRCWWCLGAPELLEYHDRVWGRPMHDELELFEMLTLESFQSGLSWLTILRKRDGFRRAFDSWDLERVAAYRESDVERLLADREIVRNRAKVEATIANARATVALHEDGATLDQLLWGFAPDPDPGVVPATGHDLRPVTPESKAMEGAQAPRIPVRRTDHGVLADGGGRSRQRPPRRLRVSLAGDRPLRRLLAQPPRDRRRGLADRVELG